MSGTLILPKVRKTDGHIVATSIDTDMIKGCEPREVTVNGKKYAGTKIYTDNGNTFYVLAPPTHVVAAKQVAASTQKLIAVDSLIAFKSYTAEVHNTLQMQQKMLALASKSSAE